MAQQGWIATMADAGRKFLEELGERAEDAEDLRTLKAMRRRPLEFCRLDDFLKSYRPDA